MNEKRSSDAFQSISNRKQGRKRSNKPFDYKADAGSPFPRKRKKSGQKRAA